MEYFFIILLISTFVNCVLCNDDSEIIKVMKNLEVIPDVIDDGPQEYLKITYKNNLKADKGIELTPTQVKDQPKVEWKADKNAYYTLIMTDPDAPSRADPKFREFKHWLVVNIPESQLDQGEVLAQYVGAGPPKGTGLHRYIFLLYKQPSKLDFDEPRVSNRSREGRRQFSARKFAEKYQLGKPIALNLFQAKYDDYVPTLHAQLSN